MKEQLLKQILKEPANIKREELNRLIWSDDASQLINRTDLKELFLKVYDLNDTTELGQADSGFLGKLNRRSNKRRNNRFYKRLKKDVNRTKIYVEGDSWFQHPLIPDIIDKIDKVSKKEYAIYSSAMGGEWWINIIEQGDYIPEISKIKPDVILLSGAGNDLVGGRKVSNLVNPNRPYLAEDLKDINLNNFNETITNHPFLSRIINVSDDTLSDTEKEFLIYGLKVLSKEFFSLMWILELMYKYVIRNIITKHSNAKLITQGYDYPIPSYKKSIKPARVLCAWGGLKNGHWLADALNLAGIDKDQQKKVTCTLIYVFNELLIGLTKEERINTNLFHIDARNITKGNIKNWFDEMHVNPDIFEKIASAYVSCIEQNTSEPKVLIVKDFV